MTPYRLKQYHEIGSMLAPMIWEGLFDWEQRYDDEYLMRFSRIHGIRLGRLKDFISAMTIEIAHQSKSFRDKDPDLAYEKAKTRVLSLLSSYEKNRGKYVAVAVPKKQNDREENS